MTCPICESHYDDMHKWINCESFDDSFLYKDIYVKKCSSCGHIYNRLLDKERNDLKRYYSEEYSQSNLSSNDNEGDKPGTNNYFNLKRYEQVEEFIMDNGVKYDSRILDVGCAMGGFLKHLDSKGFINLYGIDMIKAYVDKADNENIKVGSVYKIPFEDDSFDIVILDQVLEHLFNLRLAMKEIRRVLKRGGLVYIGVPDADRYDDIYFWLMREHIQHFNLVGLKLLAEKNGFELINHKDDDFDMIGSLKLPNISVLLKTSDTVYCWGIGREFFYLYKNTRLKNLDLILIDDTPYKQKQTFKGMNIYGSETLQHASEDSFLIITAKVHLLKLIQKAQELGYRGKIIDV